MRVLAITHGPSVGPGVFADAVRAAGHELIEHQLPTAGALDHREADAIVVLGGAMHPDEDERHGWLRPELRYLEQQLEHGTPMLGVCLGSQLIARAAGARVFRADAPEVGWFPVDVTEAGETDPVATALPSRFDAFQWHHYTHDLPDGAVELARSERLPAGLPARQRVGRPVPPGGAGGAGRVVARRRSRRRRRPGCAARRDPRSASRTGTSSAVGSARPF